MATKPKVWERQTKPIAPKPAAPWERQIKPIHPKPKPRKGA